MNAPISHHAILAALREENDILRETVRQLREDLAPVRSFPAAWKLTPQQATILSCIMAASPGVATYSRIITALYGHDEPPDWVDKMLHVMVSEIRKSLRETGTEPGIRNIAGRGQEYGTIIVGDVSPSKLGRTAMAKSVYDAGWAGFKEMLSYKSTKNGGRFSEVSEAMSTQTCSACGSIPSSRPKGIAGLRIREWACDDCGTLHDRDANSARNILVTGMNALSAESAKSRQCPDLLNMQTEMGE